MSKYNFNIKMDFDLAKRFKKVAVHNDEDMSKLVRKWIKEYVGKNSQLALKE